MISVLAYLDPGSGSLILQMLLGGFAGAVVGVKLFGRRILSFLTFWKRDIETESEPPAASAVDEA